MITFLNPLAVLCFDVVGGGGGGGGGCADRELGLLLLQIGRGRRVALYRVGRQEGRVRANNLKYRDQLLITGLGIVISTQASLSMVYLSFYASYMLKRKGVTHRHLEKPNPPSTSSVIMSLL